MILLETSNRILEETVHSRILAPKHDAVDVTLADFDGVTFHIATPGAQRNVLTVSIGWRCISEIWKYGVEAAMKRVYGPLYQSTPEPGYDVTLQFDMDALSESEKVSLPRSISMLKRHIIAVPFLAVFDAVSGTGGSVPNVVAVNYRSNEAMYIRPEGDRVIVIFSINFKDSGDIVLSKLFLQEFVDCRRTMSNAPSVLYQRDDRESSGAPPELKGVEGVYEGADQGFVSFVLFKNHLAKDRRDKTIDTITLFRNYLHYHIKCSKAYMHTRMRLRVESLLQVLNRAKTKKANKATTASGKTFERKV